MLDKEERAKITQVFEELSDAPPRRRIKFNLTGKIGILFVVFWVVMVFAGPYVSPFHEADILDESLFVVPGGDEYPDTDYQPPNKICVR